MRNNITYADCFAEAQADYRGKARGPLEMPPTQRPRERLAEKGPQALSDADLLAILLNTGIKGKNVSELAGELLNLLDRSKGIPSVEDLSRLSGMGNSKACAIAAMLEFGRRRWGVSGCVIKHPSDIFSLVRHNADRKQERFISISLNGAHEVLSVRVVTVGLVNRTIVHPREVFADLIQDRAAAFAVAHNHPSGRLSPSPEDNEITDRLRKAAYILGLHFMDHLIFSPTDFYSYRNNGRMGDLGKAFPEGYDFQPELRALLEGL
ncbi:MAG: DNA repair protein RadC [Treponema sp.]|nr:DNA repair protein RadC [Treponema sp.]